VSQDGVVIGRLQTASFSGSQAVTKYGRNYFQVPPAEKVSASTAQVRQGALESSNVNAAEAAVRLVTVMRQFEMLQRAVTIGGEMGKALQEIAKV
jgi:flagellar basal-body rod protein FlgG